MHQALYRSFRPETFDEMLGQEHIVRILRNQLKTGTVSHAYLFCGTRGTGKTTTARLLAKGLNCTGEGERPCGTCDACKAIAAGTYIDVIEIDAASNNGVDNIRELRESVKYPPAVGPYKVYIIDEVHMLTTEAFNALLKTLEEPPEGIVFILASTEPQRIPATILSRCLRLDFRRVPEQKMREGLRKICAKLGVKISDAALGLIAANADGSVRDALSLLDQCLSGGDQSISRKEVLDLLGTSGEEVFIELTDRVTKGETAEGLKLLGRVLDDGKDVRQLLRDWMDHSRDLLIAKYVDRPEDILNLSGENTARLKAQ
ncbi:MAG: DNA polymerase III subunit gamma/tau, partial [Firmicutes bacterium]|nr:DNA polymerase III subunit gamma/tau [Bacillota bacterium]